MQNAIVRINELQNEIKAKSKQIEGAEQYVEKQMQLFQKDMMLRKEFVIIEQESRKIAEDFFKHNLHIKNPAMINSEESDGF